MVTNNGKHSSRLDGMIAFICSVIYVSLYGEIVVHMGKTIGDVRRGQRVPFSKSVETP